MRKLFQKNLKVFLLVQLGILLFPISNNYRLLLYGSKAQVYTDFFIEESRLEEGYGSYKEFLVFKNSDGETVQVPKPDHLNFKQNEAVWLLYSPFDNEDVLVLTLAGFVSPFNGTIMLMCTVFWAVFCLTMDVSIMYSWLIKRTA